MKNGNKARKYHSWLCNLTQEKCKISSVNDIFQNTEKLLYVNDFLTLWRFMIEVEEIDEIKEVKEVEVLLSFGKMPDEAPTVQFVSDQLNYSDNEDVYEDTQDEFNDFENYEDY